jgi:2-hydroxychromene-2-carboxylate isomerase
MRGQLAVRSSSLDRILEATATLSVPAMPVIEVYADIWCPFAHVGLRSIMRRRHQLGRDDITLRVRAWPLELVNGAPLDPVATAEHIDDLRMQVTPHLFAGFDPDHFPHTSLPSLALAAAAYRRDTRAGEAVSLALRDALFEEGRDISQPDVLAGIADLHSVQVSVLDDEMAVLADWREGLSRRVQGSPHFFCNDREAFCPSLDISKDAHGHLHFHRNTRALDEFLDQCFGPGLGPSEREVTVRGSRVAHREHTPGPSGEK